MIESVVIFGAGGHAKVVADILISTHKFKISYFIDDTKHGQKIWSIPVVSESDFFNLKSIYSGVVAIGDNFIREKVADKIKKQLPNFQFVSAIHPTAYIANDVVIGIGTVIMANASVNPSTKIGNHCIINTNSSIDHDCIMHDFSSIAPNSCLGGNCEIGKHSAISIGATLIHKISVGENSVVGAGSVVTKSIESNLTCYGVPAKITRSRSLGEKYLK